MNKIEEAELLFAELEKLSQKANMSPREYILENGTVDEGSADPISRWDGGGELFTMEDMSFMTFYIQPHWPNQIVMMLFPLNWEGKDSITYVVWRRELIKDYTKQLALQLRKASLTGGNIDFNKQYYYEMDIHTTTKDDRWAAKEDWIYLDLGGVHYLTFLNWAVNPLEVTE